MQVNSKLSTSWLRISIFLGFIKSKIFSLANLIQSNAEGKSSVFAPPFSFKSGKLHLIDKSKIQKSTSYPDDRIFVTPAIDTIIKIKPTPDIDRMIQNKAHLYNLLENQKKAMRLSLIELSKDLHQKTTNSKPFKK